MQNETAARLNRTTDVDMPLQDVVRNAVFGALRNNAEPFEQIREADVVGAVIDNQAHCAVIGVGTHIDDRPREPPICHKRHGHKKLPLEKGIGASFSFRLWCHHKERVALAAVICEAAFSRVSRKGCVRTAFRKIPADVLVKCVRSSARKGQSLMKVPLSPVFCRTLGFIFALVVAASSGAPHAFAASSLWVQGHKTQARLVSGQTGGEQGAQRFAFVEIELQPGWKTYWRTPGDAGGLPPSFDWSKSSNLASADVRYPAPQRFTDKSGNTIGYEGGLVLPVVLTPESAEKPISLVGELHYGICKDICVPVELELTLDIPAKSAEAASAEALEALASVPRAQDQLKPVDPVLLRAETALTGTAPKITIEARFPQGADGADAFLEAPDGLFLPLPEKVGDPKDGKVTFEAALGPDVDLAALKGKPITVTLVGETGSSFATFPAQ